MTAVCMVSRVIIYASEYMTLSSSESLLSQSTQMLRVSRAGLYASAKNCLGILRACCESNFILISNLLIKIFGSESCHKLVTVITQLTFLSVKLGYIFK
jgi:hypothetical protein